MTSRLTLAKYRSIPRFLRATMAIRRQLAQSEGLVGCSLKTDLPRKTFYTYSAWADDASVQRFASSDPHAREIRGLRPNMKDSHFEFTTTRGRDLPAPWKELVATVAGPALAKGTAQ
jgi:hypothetical protein